MSVSDEKGHHSLQLNSGCNCFVSVLHRGQMGSLIRTPSPKPVQSLEHNSPLVCEHQEIPTHLC